MYIRNEDTICAPATVPGTGAISVIRVSGSKALSIADQVVACRTGSISEADGYTIKFGTVSDADGRVIDDVLASVFRAPRSYTGEDSVEISCHASSYIVSEIMSLNESALHIRWSKYWSFSISPSNQYLGLISFWIDWFDLLAVPGLSRVFSSTIIQKHQFSGA